MRTLLLGYRKRSRPKDDSLTYKGELEKKGVRPGYGLTARLTLEECSKITEQVKTIDTKDKLLIAIYTGSRARVQYFPGEEISRLSPFPLKMTLMPFGIWLKMGYNVR